MAGMVAGGIKKIYHGGTETRRKARNWPRMNAN
jgi:hypothetical protein